MATVKTIEIGWDFEAVAAAARRMQEAMNKTAVAFRRLEKPMEITAYRMRGEWNRYQMVGERSTSATPSTASTDSGSSEPRKPRSPGER